MWVPTLAPLLVLLPAKLFRSRQSGVPDLFLYARKLHSGKVAFAKIRPGQTAGGHLTQHVDQIEEQAFYGQPEADRADLMAHRERIESRRLADLATHGTSCSRIDEACIPSTVSVRIGWY